MFITGQVIDKISSHSLFTSTVVFCRQSGEDIQSYTFFFPKFITYLFLRPDTLVSTDKEAL